MAENGNTVVTSPDSNKKEAIKPQVSETKLDADKEVKNGFVKTDITSTNQNNEVLSWSGPEFISYEKNSTWYMYLILLSVILSVLDYVIFKDIITIFVIIIFALVFSVYGSRKPKDIPFSVDNEGFTVGQKNYFYDEFRKFNILEEGNFVSINFMPLKRFALTASLYFPKEYQDKILAILNDKLPYEHQKPYLIDDLMRRIKF
jgi:hypothetical protein